MYKNFIPLITEIIFHCVYVHFIYSSVDKRLDCFSHSAFLSNAAMNIGMQRCIWVAVFNYFCIYLEVRWLGHMVVPFFSFLKNYTVAPFYSPVAMQESTNFSIFSQTCYFLSWMWVWKVFHCFFLKFILLSIIDLQCINFYAVHQSESVIHKHISIFF